MKKVAGFHSLRIGFFEGSDTSLDLLNALGMIDCHMEG